MPYLLLGAGIGDFIHGFVPAETILPIGLALIEKGIERRGCAGAGHWWRRSNIPEPALLSAIFEKKLLAVFVLTIN